MVSKITTNEQQRNIAISKFWRIMQSEPSIVPLAEERLKIE